MYFLDTATAVESLHTFWGAIQALIPADVDLQVENAGDIIEDTTGALTGAWTATPVAVVSGSSGDRYAAPAGAVVNWLTETIGGGRRLRGRTFLVPLASGRFQNDGSVDDDGRVIIQEAATALIAEQSASFVIWHRGTGSNGSDGLVTAARVSDMVAVLTSRRD